MATTGAAQPPEDSTMEEFFKNVSAQGPGPASRSTWPSSTPSPNAAHGRIWRRVAQDAEGGSPRWRCRPPGSTRSSSSSPTASTGCRRFALEDQRDGENPDLPARRARGGLQGARPALARPRPRPPASRIRRPAAGRHGHRARAGVHGRGRRRHPAADRGPRRRQQPQPPRRITSTCSAGTARPCASRLLTTRDGVGARSRRKSSSPSPPSALGPARAAAPSK